MRRNVPVFGLPVVVALGVMVAVASCGGGGERPPPEQNSMPDSGSSSSSSSSGAPPATELITGLEEGPDGIGLYFGDNGYVNCGKQASEKTLVLNNPTDDVLNFEAKITDGEKYYTVHPPKGGVPIRGTAVIKIVPAAIPTTSEVTPDLYAGTLELKLGTLLPENIRLHQTARGAIVTSNAGSEIDFGSVRIGSSEPYTLNFKNSGNVEVTANLSVSSSAFRIESAATASLTLAPAGAGSKEIAFSPTQAQEYLDTLTVAFDPSVPHCAPPPSTISLKGQGNLSVGVSPGTLSFGLVECGTAAPFQTVTISSSSAMTFVASLGKSATSPYTLADESGSPVALGSTISMPAASTYVLRVVPKPIPVPANLSANAYDDTLTITTDVPTDTPHTVQLRQSATGAVFVLEPQAITVTGNVNETKTTNFTLRNTGNASAPYQISVTPDTTFSSSITSGTVQGGATVTGILTTKLPNTFSTEVQGSIQVTSPGGVLCADLPSPVALTASTGQGTSVTVTPTSLNFGQVNCGDTAPFQTVEISSIVATTFRPNLNLGAGSPYTLADSEGVPITLGTDIAISPGSPYTLRVVPKAVPIPSSTATNALGDTLTITSPADGNTPKNVTLTQTARGAIFALTPPSIDFGTASTRDFQLVNSGNAPADYKITVTGPFTSNRTEGSAPVGTLNGTLTKTGAGTGTLSVTSTDVLCADLPPPVSLTAN